MHTQGPFYPKSGPRLRSHPSYSASASRPASVISIHVTSIIRCPACTVRVSAVASPLRTRSCSVSIPKPCVRRIDSVCRSDCRRASVTLRAGRRVSPCRNRSTPSRPARGRRRGDAQETLSAPPSARLGGAARGVTMPANAGGGKPGREFHQVNVRSGVPDRVYDTPITGRGTVQASVAERCGALPPAKGARNARNPALRRPSL
jgi:hypothetical protein